MRTKPPGQDQCRKKRRRNSSASRGMDTQFSAVPIIAPAEADFFAVEGGDAVVRYGHSVGVTAGIADMFRSAEGRLGIDVPVLLTHFLDQLFEPAGIAEISGRDRGNRAGFCGKAGEVRQGTSCGRRCAVPEWAAGTAGGCGNPSLMIGGQSAAGDDAMDVIIPSRV